MDKERTDFPHSFESKPDFAFFNVSIPEGRTLKVEASAMATMDTNVKMKTKMKGGLGRMFSGESLFINEFTAEGGEAQVGIAPPSPGDATHVYLEDEVVFLQNSAFVAASPEVEVASKWQGMVKGFFSGEKLFIIRCAGTGDLWFSTYGAMIEVDVEDSYVVDTGHVVAFTEGLSYNVSRVGDYKSLFLSGEGLVCRFTGQGKVWIQTRKVAALGAWVYPYRPTKNTD
jgi:uncharacterized protein (TIGR00266 family)